MWNFHRAVWDSLVQYMYTLTHPEKKRVCTHTAEHVINNSLIILAADRTLLLIGVVNITSLLVGLAPGFVERRIIVNPDRIRGSGIILDAVPGGGQPTHSIMRAISEKFRLSSSSENQHGKVVKIYDRTNTRFFLLIY